MKKRYILFGILAILMLSIVYVNAVPTINATATVTNSDQIKISWDNPYNNVKEYPYSYKLMQSSDNGASYHPISTWVDGQKVKVLNLRPKNTKQHLTDWMSVAGRGMIDITEVYLEDYNKNPNSYLKDANGKYKYDVLVFGTSDWNGKEDLSSIGFTATDDFIQAGRGVLFGHDTILSAVNNNPWWGTAANHPNFNRLAHYVGIVADGTYALTNRHSSKVKVVNKGLLTSFPNKLDSGTLDIPSTHAFGQYVNNTSTIWMTLFDDMRANANGALTDWYLVSKNNTAMIQTGHSDSTPPTLDEEKVFANTIFYLKQITDNTYAFDNTAYDNLAPSNLKATRITCPNSDDYKINLRLSAVDKGNTYKYYVEGYPQRDGYGSKMQSNVVSIASASGVSGYWYTINTSSSPITKPSAAANGWVAPNNGSNYDFTTSVLDSNKTYYLHYFAKDKKGNVSNEVVYTIMPNAAPSINVADKTFYEGEYTVEEWHEDVRSSGLTATDKEDGNITNSIVLLSDPVNPTEPGKYTVKYKVTDSGCKTSFKDNNITVLFNNPPIIQNQDYTFYENEITLDTWKKNFQMKVQASDVEDGNLTSKIELESDNVNPSTPGEYQAVYSVTDQYNKTTRATTTVKIKYNFAPLIVAKDRKYTQNAFGQGEWKDHIMDDVEAIDVEDGNITNKIQVIEDDVDIENVGFYHVKLEVTDAYGKKHSKTIRVEVVYNVPPMIMADNKSFFENELSEEQWREEVLKNVTAFDSEDGDITKKIEIIKDNVNLNKPGSYEVTYSVTDSHGKTSEKTIDITIKNNHEPQLEIIVENKRIVEGQYTLEEWISQIRMEDVKAHDVEDNDLTNQIEVVKDNVKPDKDGTYEVTYRVTDKYGKSTEKTIKVTVEPNLPPVIHASEKWFDISDDITDKAILKDVIAYDDLDGDISKQVTIKDNTINKDKAGDYTVTYYVKDSLGKDVSLTVTIHVTDKGGKPDPNPVDPPIPPSSKDSVIFANGKNYGEVHLSKVMEQSDLTDKPYDSVVFGVFAAEDIEYKNSIVLKKDNLVGIIKLDKDHNGYTNVYHEGHYYVQEIAVDDPYILSDEKHYFQLEY